VNQHVKAFTWSPDSTRILYRLADSPDIESEALPISENIVSIQEKGGDLHFRFTHVMTHDRQMFLNSVWTEPGRFYFLHSEDYAAATPALWKCETAPGTSPTRVAFGDTDDAAGLVRLSNEVAVGVACGLETRIEITGPNSISFTAFETSEDAFASWDIKQVNGKYIFVALRSSGVTAEVDNIWSGSTVPGTKGVLSTKLSSHHEWVLGKELPQCAPFYWSIEDGTALQGVATYPRGQLLKNLPTVVVPHGGPYW
jgi:dipeptidyl aminopeptidase/acylaminoacyl peptidase